MQFIEGILTNDDSVTKRFCPNKTIIKHEIVKGKVVFNEHKGFCSIDCSCFAIHSLGKDLVDGKKTLVPFGETDIYYATFRCQNGDDGGPNRYQVNIDEKTKDLLLKRDIPGIAPPPPRAQLKFSGPAKNERDLFLRTGKKKEKPE